MCAFEEEIIFLSKKNKCYSPAGEQSFVLFTGEWYFSDKSNETMEIVFLLQ
jgi:hypothetical protein